MEKEREESGAVITGVVGASVGPLASDGLDEAFGLPLNGGKANLNVRDRNVCETALRTVSRLVR